MKTHLFTQSFNATHAVRLADGPEGVHGHDWGVTLQVCSADEAADWTNVSAALNTVLEPLRHSHLNDLPALAPHDASAEAVAAYIFQQVEKRLNGEFAIVSVHVEEEPGCRAGYLGDRFYA